jgi:hypothetical protein
MDDQYQPPVIRVFVSAVLSYTQRTEVKPYDDDVMFTVYRPEIVGPQKWYSLLEGTDR